MAVLYHLLVHGIILGCLYCSFVLLCCFMSCLPWLLLFDVFCGGYLGGVSVLSDVASCLVRVFRGCICFERSCSILC